MADKVPEILQSVNEDNGARTVIKTVLGPGATVFPHYHTLFSETFEVLVGEIDIWNGDLKMSLHVGESATIQKGTVHRYQVGQEETTVKLTFVPGDLNFEHAMKIIRGAQNDGTYTQLSAPDKGDLVFLAVIADLTNSNAVGDTKADLDALYLSDGSKVELIKKELLAKYVPGP